MTIIVVKKIPSLVCHQYLVGLLKVLSSEVVIGALRRQNVVSDFLEIIGIKDISGHGQHTFERKHKFDGRTKLRPLGGAGGEAEFQPAVFDEGWERGVESGEE